MNKVLYLIFSLLLVTSMMLAGCTDIDDKNLTQTTTVSTTTYQTTTVFNETVTATKTLIVFPPTTVTYKKGDSVTRWGTEIILNTDLPEFPDKLNYYATVEPEVTIELVEELGAKLGFYGEAGLLNDSIGMSNNEESLKVYTSTGAIVLWGINKHFELDTQLTSFENAEEIAIEFVKYIGCRDDNIEFNEVRVGGTVNTTPSHLVASFNQYIDGYPLVGGAKNFWVRMGMYGTVISAMIWNPELVYAGEVDCITVQEAYSILLSGNALEFMVSSESQIRINEVSIGYYLEDMTELQDYVMPVYIFEGERVYSDRDTEVFRCYVEAAK